MRKRNLFGLGFATLALFGAVAVGVAVSAHVNEPAIAVLAEGEGEGSEERTAATVSINKIGHGSVEADILEGNEGDICTLNIRPEILYVISSVKVNGTALIEDENISGLYKFALVRGENIVEVKIVVDETLLGDLSVIYAQARDKDWTNLFSTENILRLVSFVLNGGVLFAVIRYVIRDKRLVAKVEKGAKESIEKVVPETTRQIVTKTVQEFIEPMFVQMKADNIEMMRALGVFAKVLALAQEDTPESRVAILNILSELKISDEQTLAEVKAYIDQFFAENMKKYEEILKQIEAIGQASQEIMGNEEPAPEAAPVEDGTSI